MIAADGVPQQHAVRVTHSERDARLRVKPAMTATVWAAMTAGAGGHAGPPLRWHGRRRGVRANTVRPYGYTGTGRERGAAGAEPPPYIGTVDSAGGVIAGLTRNRPTCVQISKNMV